MADADSIPAQLQCRFCGEFKPLLDFKKRKDAPYGVTTFCKSCGNQKNREYNAANPEIAKSWHDKWTAKNPEKVNARKKRFLDKNDGYMSKRQAEYRDRHPVRSREISLRATRKRRQNVAVRIHDAVGNRLRGALQKGCKSKKTLDLLGFSIKQLMCHLELQFLPGMTWKNFGEWHIDHILPLSSFDIRSEDDPELLRAWALPNLRPLWGVDNMRKKDKILFLI